MKIMIYAILLFCLVPGCTPKISKVKENAVYEIINDFYARTKAGPPYSTSKILLSKEIMPGPLFDYNSLRPELRDTFSLKKEDFEYMQEQEKLQKGFELDGEKIKNMKVINYSEIADCVDADGKVNWPKFSKRTQIEKFSTISIPYLSKDRKFALFQVCEYSPKFYEEGGQVLLFKNVNGKWEFYSQLWYWESGN